MKNTTYYAITAHEYTTRSSQYPPYVVRAWAWFIVDTFPRDTEKRVRAKSASPIHPMTLTEMDRAARDTIKHQYGTHEMENDYDTETLATMLANVRIVPRSRLMAYHIPFPTDPTGESAGNDG